MSWRPAKRIKSHSDTTYITSLDFDDAGNWALTSGTDRCIQLYDCIKGKQERTLQCTKYGAHLAKFTHSSSACLHAAVYETDLVYHLSLHANSYIRFFKGHANKVTGLEVSPVDNTFITASLDRTVRIWDLRVSSCVGLLNLPSPGMVTFDATGSVFAVASQEMRTAALYDMRNIQKDPFVTFSAQIPGVWQKVEFTNDSKYVVIAGTGSYHGVFDGFNGKIITTLSGHTPLSRPMPSVSPVAADPEGKHLFVGSGDNKIHVYNLQEFKADTPFRPVETLEAPHQPALLVLNGQNKLLGNADADLVFWLPQKD